MAFYSTSVCRIKKAILGSKVTSQKWLKKKNILVSTRTSEDITSKCFGCIRRVAKKATISFVMSACRFARLCDTASFSADRILWCLIPRNFITILSRKLKLCYIGQKYQVVYCELVLLLGGTPLGTLWPHRTMTWRARLLLSVRTQQWSTVRAQPYYSNMFIVVCTAIHAAQKGTRALCRKVIFGHQP